VHRRWIILGVLFLARTAMGFQYESIGSVGPSLIDAFHIGFTAVGTLIGLYHITGVLLSLPGGFIIQRLGDKTTCAAGLAMMVVGGLILAAADTYGQAFAGRLLSGMGGILFNVVLSKMTADWFARREIVLAMAVVLSTWPFGIALGLFVQPRIAEAFGWRAVMLSSASFCLVSLLLMTIFYRAPPDAPARPAASVGRTALPPARALAPVIVAGLMWGAFNAGVVAYFSFVPVLLSERGGMTLIESGSLTSLALWIGMLSIPSGGFIAQRLRRPDETVVVFCGAAATALAAIVAGAPALPACIAFGLAIGPPPGVITSLPTRILTSEQRAPGFGAFYTCHFLLQAAGPAVAGWLRDSAGGGAAVGFAASLLLVPLPLLAVFEMLARRARRV
jgi:predicted MFS family arabinose efflux permease